MNRYRDENGDLRPATNVEFVTDLMERSRNGALMQAFVLTAVERYAAQCIDAGPQDFDTPLLNGYAWIACATEAKAAVDKHLKD